MKGAYHSSKQMSYKNTTMLDIDIENRREGNKREETNYAFLYDDNNDSVPSLDTGTIEYESTNSPTNNGGGARSTGNEIIDSHSQNSWNDEDARVSINSTEIFGVRRVTRNRPRRGNIQFP